MNLLNIDDLSDEQIRRYLKEEKYRKAAWKLYFKYDVITKSFINTQN